LKLLNHGGPSYYIHVYNCKFRDKIVDDYIEIILNKINFVEMIIFLLTILLHLNENDLSLVCNYIAVPFPPVRNLIKVQHILKS